MFIVLFALSYLRFGLCVTNNILSLSDWHFAESQLCFKFPSDSGAGSSCVGICAAVLGTSVAQNTWGTAAAREQLVLGCSVWS